MKKIDINSLFFARVSDFIKIYIPHQRNGSSHTVRTYRYALLEFRTYVESVAKISRKKFRYEDCTYDFILDYRNYLYDVKKQKERTVNTKLCAIKSYLSYVAAKDITVQQVEFAVHQVPLYNEPQNLQPIIEDIDALEALLTAPSNTRQGLRDKVILSVLYDAALRVDELASLTMNCVKQDNNNLFKLHVSGKNKKNRNLLLSAETSALIMQYINEYHFDTNPEDAFIYSNFNRKKHLTTRAIEKLVKKYSDLIRDKYTLPVSVSPHTLRRTRGTLLYRDGVPMEEIALFMGHANIQTTRDHYASPSNDQIRKIAQRKTEFIPNVEQLWPDDQDEIDRLLDF